MKARRFVVTLFLAMAFVGLALLPAYGTKAYAADEITFGIIGPMKFTYGSNIWMGAEMAAEKINAAGGIKVKGKSYKLVLYKTDDNDFISVPDAVSAMERLITVQKVKLIIGGVRSEAVLAQQEVAMDNKAIFLGAGSASNELNYRVAKDYNRYKYWFRIMPGASEDSGLQNISMTMPAIRALQKMGIKKPKVALLFDKATWTEPIIPLAKKLFPELGCEVVGVWQPGFNATSFSSELSAIKSAGAHIIFMLCAGAPGNVFSKQWGELQIPATLSGTNVEATLETHWKATDGKCNYIATGSGFADVPLTSQTKQFFADFKKKYKEGPNYLAGAGHDGVYILKEAIEKADSWEPDDLVPVLEKTNREGVTGHTVFTPIGTKRPHDLVWSTKGYTPVQMQWIDGKQYVTWPDGKELPPAIIAAGGSTGWDKKKLKGTVDYVLPPWVIEYWKDKK